MHRLLLPSACVEMDERGPCGLLLGILLGPARTAPDLLAGDESDGLEVLVMGRAGVTHNDVLYGSPLTLQGLLELRLGVETALLRPLEALAERCHDRRAHRLPAVLEVDGADRGLHQRRQHGRRADQPLGVVAPALRPVGEHAAAEVDLPRHRRARSPRDDVGLEAGEAALVGDRVATVELLGDDRPEDGITEELQPFVRVAARFVPRGVAEDPPPELVRQRIDEVREVSRRLSQRARR